ncbi:MAG TPA: pantoate--beta-alanine ligase [Pelagibacterium sp.]|uniref:pantoate--beta-alanine ligase n=1 Tax=Pelagibacterium sp. TaxID=1967288 RepID=UPI002CAF8530|nr:pantoate--beta-alanine ligase [Pelagibacterium sp.]HWJ87214.1 pantoate--beta-alanine ligase [Pelagibacterium sp.]
MTRIVRTVADLRSVVAQWHDSGDRVAVVPTMGALHDGHMALVQAARDMAERVIVSVFVNPKQFNDANDLAKYPRDEEADFKRLSAGGADLMYAPDAGEIYPDGFVTKVSVSGLSEGLCGAHRPGHFDGVATVVAKLLLQTRADVALFGEKDYQQLAIIRRLVRDLDIEVEVVGVSTVREPDGLALSSRNVRLGENARKIAPSLAAALMTAARNIEAGQEVSQAIAEARQAVLAAGYAEVEYLELRDSDTLERVSKLTKPARLLVAAWLDGVRLIDNVALTPEAKPPMSRPNVDGK